jgi:transcriptional regulator with XRE-family HTH domain
MSETDAVPLSKRRKLLRTFRKQYGITLDELGDLTDLSKSMLSLFENGERDLSLEAWARVLAAMSKLITEDDARRLAEIEKAKQTAEKLGAPGIFGVRPGKLIEYLFKGDEQIAKEQAEIEAERIRLQEAGNLSELIVEQSNELQKEFAAQVTKEEVLEQYCALWASADKLNRELRDLEARGYALFLKSDVEAKDKRIAELEQSK